MHLYDEEITSALAESSDDQKYAQFSEITVSRFHNIPHYIEAIAKEETNSVPEALAHLKTALDEVYAAEDRLIKMLQEARLMQIDEK